MGGCIFSWLLVHWSQIAFCDLETDAERATVSTAGMEGASRPTAFVAFLLLLPAYLLSQQNWQDCQVTGGVFCDILDDEN
jgi:hypothetical protein